MQLLLLILQLVIHITTTRNNTCITIFYIVASYIYVCMVSTLYVQQTMPYNIHLPYAIIYRPHTCPTSYDTAACMYNTLCHLSLQSTSHSNNKRQ